MKQGFVVLPPLCRILCRILCDQVQSQMRALMLEGMSRHARFDNLWVVSDQGRLQLSKETAVCVV